jgi:hypothetical protein
VVGQLLTHLQELEEIVHSQVEQAAAPQMAVAVAVALGAQEQRVGHQANQDLAE